MKPDDRFSQQTLTFWANVRSISEKIGYTDRGTRRIRVPGPAEIRSAYASLGLTTHHLLDQDSATELGQTLLDYFAYRAEVLDNTVEGLLMDADEARSRLAELQRRAAIPYPVTLNKQKGEKAGPALFTNAINLLIRIELGDDACDMNPQRLTTFTRDDVPVRTLARRVDGAYPGTVNPVAIWEIKEYYHTTTFGSRVAGGVYETLLDGLELQEMRTGERIACRHYLFVDSHNTWWNMGRSYLCRMVDMLHMGYVDEVIFGKEIYERIPALVAEWRRSARQRDRP